MLDLEERRLVLPGGWSTARGSLCPRALQGLCTPRAAATGLPGPQMPSPNPALQARAGAWPTLVGGWGQDLCSAGVGGTWWLKVSRGAARSPGLGEGCCLP